jgi:hypothetical protein
VTQSLFTAEPSAVESPSNAGGAAPRLAWRIPTDASLHRRSAKMLQVAFAGSICLAAAFVFGAGKLHWPALVAGGCLLLGAIAYWSWRWRRSRHNSDNVWLDDDGLHWFDGSAAAGLSRRQVEGFRIGLDPDTVRAIPALTLILVGGFESQPVELHAPAAPSTVRDFLVQHWRLPEIEPSPTPSGCCWTA